jgi:hypothetical protein
MPSQHLSIRIETDALERLDAESRRSGRSRSEVAKSLIEEGLRMQQHPGIVFRPGPSGRRPGLAGGPDVWEVIRVFLGVAAGSDPVGQVVELTGLAPDQVRAAVRYYAEYRDEILAWIERVDELAASAEKIWRQEQELLRS